MREKPLSPLLLELICRKKKSHLVTALMKLLQTGEIGDEEFYCQYFDDAVIPLRYQAPPCSSFVC